ncbi:MAG: sodium:solute symporter [Sphingobacteriales bacterium]|nr:sodium:solute symporter [Sphingobacteriales bacterium]
MSSIDWIVLIVTLIGIITYGVYKSRTSRNLDGYFLGDRKMPWWLVLLSIMGTQASAVTFLSAPGQAYTDGMRFVQYYFGLPIAMIIICIAFVPIFHRLKVYTAYEYLEQRFDVKTRTLTSFLFLLSRGLSTGISVFAPSIILSSLFGWNIYWTNIFMGGLLIIYTVTGGAKAVAYTQQLQLIIVFVGMFLAAYMVVNLLPSNVGFVDALKVSGKLGKLNVITTAIKKDGSFNWSDQYNLFSGLIGGLFLSLSYFGTDQSQVGRYLTAKSETQSRLGLLMNGLVKVPMQFAILLIGAMVFTFYQFKSSPLFFNEVQVVKVQASVYADSAKTIQHQYDSLNKLKESYVMEYVNAYQAGLPTDAYEQNWKSAQTQTDTLRTHFKNLVKKKEVGGDANDTNYIFLHFVVDYLPKGLVGLLIAIIFLASWGSIAAALNSLASCTMVDFHRRFSKRELTEETEYRLSKWYTFGWGVFCIIIAMFAYNLGNSLIEAVNVLGSLFYGVILGIFLVAFFLKSIGGKAVFVAAIITELFILFIFYLIKKETISLGFLWLNPIGAGGVVLVGLLVQSILPRKKKAEATVF